jgi:hypothetical protein
VDISNGGTLSAAGDDITADSMNMVYTVSDGAKCRVTLKVNSKLPTGVTLRDLALCSTPSTQPPTPTPAPTALPPKTAPPTPPPPAKEAGPRIQTGPEPEPLPLWATILLAIIGTLGGAGAISLSCSPRLRAWVSAHVQSSSASITTSMRNIECCNCCNERHVVVGDVRNQNAQTSPGPAANSGDHLGDRSTAVQRAAGICKATIATAV